MKSARNILYICFIQLLLLQIIYSQDLPQRGICAHRGANSTHPENTISAFKEAIRLGAHMIELDVQMSRDSVLVIMHDASVDRTTNGRGDISDLTIFEIKTLDAGSWKDTLYKNERVPTLAEALEIMPTNIWLNIHIKDNSEIGAAVSRSIIKNNRVHQAIIACGPETAAAIKKIYPRVKICNMERRDNSNQYVIETIALGSEFIQLKERADPLLPVLTKKLKQNGIYINYYGTNSGEKLKQLFAAGVDFPLVDDVSSMMKVAWELGIAPVQPIFGEQDE